LRHGAAEALVTICTSWRSGLICEIAGEGCGAPVLGTRCADPYAQIDLYGDADVICHVRHELHELYESELAILMSHRTCVGAGAPDHRAAISPV